MVKSISISEAVNNVGLNLHKLTISWEGYIFKPLTTLSGGTTKILHQRPTVHVVRVQRK